MKILRHYYWQCSHLGSNLSVFIEIMYKRPNGLTPKTYSGRNYFTNPEVNMYFTLHCYHCSDIYSNKELEATKVSNTRIMGK